jgi:hypothetical protein
MGNLSDMACSSQEPARLCVGTARPTALLVASAIQAVTGLLYRMLTPSTFIWCSSGNAVGDCGFGLAKLPIPASRIPFILPVDHWRVSSRGSPTGVLAHGDGGERRAMEGASQRRGRVTDCSKQSP